MTNMRELLHADVDRFGGVGCGERSDGRAKNCNGRRERQPGQADQSRDLKRARELHAARPALSDCEQVLVSIVRQASNQGV